MADNSTSKSGRNSVTGKPFTPFEQAFLNARKAGDKTFEFRGKTYTTKLKSEHLLMSPPEPKPSAGSDTRNQSPPGPQDAPGGLYASMTNPPERQPDQPTPDEVAQERVAQGQALPGGALGLQGPGNPAAVPGPPPGAATAPPGPDPSAQASSPPGPLRGPGDPAGGGPGAMPGPGGGNPNTQFDAELAAFQQRQASAMQGQLAQPLGQGQAAGGPIGGPGTAAGYVPPAPGQGQAAGGPIGGPGTAAGYVPPDQGQGAVGSGASPQGGNLGMGSSAPGMDQGGGAIDFQGLAQYFYELGRQSLSGPAGRLVRNKADISSMGGSR